MFRALQSWLEAEWYSNRKRTLPLWPLMLLFAAASSLRRWWFGWRPGAVYRARIPVVVVGNLSVGGTGKSPVVAAIVDALQRRGVKVGILARGYGSSSDAPRRVDVNSPAHEVGDEPLMHALATGAPVVVARDRAAGARLLESSGVEVIVCDDGLQHYALARDLEVVVVDGARGFGNGKLLPMGPLRESLSRLAGVDFLVVNGECSAALAAALESSPFSGSRLSLQLFTATPRQVAAPAKWQSLENFRGSTVHAVAGIGHPQRFFASLRSAGLQLIEHSFADHHPYTAVDLDFGDGRPILMTSKDAVKCRSFASPECWQVPVTPRLEPQDDGDLIERIALLLTARNH